MKNKEFFYLQYDKLKWENQEKTKINSFVNNYIIQNVISKKKADTIKIFDIGFGIGFFLKMLEKNLSKSSKNIILEGCEPSYKNYKHFKSKPFNLKKVKLRTFNKTFLQTQTDTKFDFITAIYVFPHFASDELNATAEKINSILDNEGKFILVVSNEKYLEEKLKSKRDLFIEKNTLEFDGRKYKEVLHYSEIPQIGTIIDYNREEKFYLDLFKKHGFDLDSKKDLDDNGFICTIFVFSKK
ncbi:MAG: class I SAM-dependent methyltransferase [archaeon]